MNKWWMVGLCSGLAVFGTTSRASAGGFELGARLGYGIPAGKFADDNSDLSDGVSGMIPLQLDLGYRVSPAFSIGGYVMYGIGFSATTFRNPVTRPTISRGSAPDCSARDVRLGIQAQFHFLPKKKLDPWLGAGLGYEWLDTRQDTSGGGREGLSVTGKGFEFINLQGGLDIKVAPGLAIGAVLVILDWSIQLRQYLLLG